MESDLQGEGDPVKYKIEDTDSATGEMDKEFITLIHHCKDGVSLISRDLRYIKVNDRMAEITGTPAGNIPGRGIQQINSSVAQALEPVLRHVIDTGNALENSNTEVTISVTSVVPECRYWIVSGYPFKNAQETVESVGIIVRDITDQYVKNIERDERLNFETLLSSLSAAFINLPLHEIDTTIESSLQKIVEFLQFDRCTIWHESHVDGRYHITCSYARPGIPHPPKVIQDIVPVWARIWQGGEIYRVSDIDELPDEQWREKIYCKELGDIKSVLFIPLQVGGVIVGVISFVSYRVKRTWPDELIQRLRLLSDIIENALERKRADQKIQKALVEIEQLKDRLFAENLYLRDQIELSRKHEEIIGQSSAIQKVLLQVEQVAATDSTVLILGETGTGKELIARAVHNLSRRSGRSMIKLNCAALPATLIEAELFGYEKGAFTGATTARIGRFEAANGSSIFLDEIGELPLELQAKLLRVLQEGQFERLGSSVPVKADVRIIAATNRNLPQTVLQGKFREDLYYRLNVFPIYLPPLRDRRDDIPLLAWAMIRDFEKVFGKTVERIPKKNMDDLMSYPWPGNIRELRNMIERAMILCTGSMLMVELPIAPAALDVQASALVDVERMHIISVMERTGWRVRGKGGAAEIMKIKPTTLDAKMKKLGIKRITLT